MSLAVLKDLGDGATFWVGIDHRPVLKVGLLGVLPSLWHEVVNDFVHHPDSGL